MFKQTEAMRSEMRADCNIVLRRYGCIKSQVHAGVHPLFSHRGIRFMRHKPKSESMNMKRMKHVWAARRW